MDEEQASASQTRKAESEMDELSRIWHKWMETGKAAAKVGNFQTADLFYDSAYALVAQDRAEREAAIANRPEPTPEEMDALLVDYFNAAF